MWWWLKTKVCIHVCVSDGSVCSGVVFLVIPCCRCDLNVLASYTHTVSMPSPAVCSGTQVGKGKRQATTLAVLSSSLASFSSSWSICRYREQQSGYQEQHFGILKTYLAWSDIELWGGDLSPINWMVSFLPRMDHFITHTCIYCTLWYCLS